jgi:hypothetical protein
MCSCFYFISESSIETLKISLFTYVLVLFLESYILLGFVAWVEAGSSTLKMEVVRSSETLVKSYRDTRLRTPEDIIFHSNYALRFKFITIFVITYNLKFFECLSEYPNPSGKNSAPESLLISRYLTYCMRSHARIEPKWKLQGQHAIPKY